MGKTNYLYLDSCVFLAYFKAEAGRIDILSQLFEDIQKNPNQKIITSVLSITEVSHAADEKNKNRLRADFTDQLDQFWADSSLIEFVDFHEAMARQARELIRRGISKGYSLKPADAIHLTSAAYVGVAEFFTYDNLLKKKNYEEFLGYSIVEPYILNPKLPL